jgi:hypothetical protein
MSDSLLEKRRRPWSALSADQGVEITDEGFFGLGTFFAGVEVVQKGGDVEALIGLDAEFGQIVAANEVDHTDPPLEMLDAGKKYRACRRDCPRPAGRNQPGPAAFSGVKL